MKFGILQTGRAPVTLVDKFGDYDEMCANLVRDEEDEVLSFAVLDGELPASVEQCDIWVITGSRFGVYEDHEWISPLETFIRSAYAAGKKIVGICFGHQILAQALGGVVEKQMTGYGVGAMDYRLALADGSETEVTLCAWHQDQIVKIPAGAKVIATSDFCPIAALTYGNQAISFQAHPEFSISYMKALIGHHAGRVISTKQGNDALMSLEKPVHADVVSARIHDFLSQDCSRNSVS